MASGSMNENGLAVLEQRDMSCCGEWDSRAPWVDGRQNERGGTQPMWGERRSASNANCENWCRRYLAVFKMCRIEGAVRHGLC